MKPSHALVIAALLSILLTLAFAVSAFLAIRQWWHRTRVQRYCRQQEAAAYREHRASRI